MSAQGVGYVAPDFDTRARFNTLRVRPEYRITLRWGDVEDLFLHPPGSLEGRMERLQVLGLFYFPLQHQKAKERFKDTWDWFKAKILGGAGDADADAAVQRGLQSRLVSGAAIPAWSDAAGPLLPPDAADPANPSAANFAKIRVPGGYSYLSFIGLELNRHDLRPAKFGLHSIHELEAWCAYDNPALGKLPLVAKVERRAGPNSDWAPAQGAAVHFQLRTPYELPAFDPGAAASAQFNRPPLAETDGLAGSTAAGKGPHKFVREAEDQFLAADDPQAKNCHKNFGGRRGYDNLTDGGDVVHSKLFWTEKVKGFNDPHEGRSLPHKKYEVATKATPSGDKHLHAVVAKTNEDGEAGVLFETSRMGGDRYRLRAYVGPPSLASDGTDPGAVQTTTGTFVVWRNIRLSRYIRQDVGPVPDARLAEQAKEANRDLLLMSGVRDQTGTFVGLPTAIFDDPHSGEAGYDPIPLQLARAYCELEKDQAAPEAIDADEWVAARKRAVEDIEAGRKSRTDLKYDWSKLLCMDMTFASPADTVVNIPMRSAAAYNAGIGFFKGLFYDKIPMTKKGAPNPMAALDVSALLGQYGLPGFLRHMTKNGALPGLTLIQGGFGYSWQLLVGDAYAGLATDFRGAFVWGGNAGYPPSGQGMMFSFSCNTLHEFGHVLFQEHAMGLDRDGHHAMGFQKNLHDDPYADSACVMGYQESLGRICGRTLLLLRGWKYER